METGKQFAKAESYLQNKQYQKAYSEFLLLYENQKNFHNNYYLFVAALNNHQYNDAYQIASEYLREYIVDNEKFNYYIKAGVLAGKNIAIQKLLYNLGIYMSATEKMTLDRIRDQNERLYWSNKGRSNIKNLVKKFSFIGAQPVIDQRQILQQAYSLPKKEFVDTALKVVQDAYVHPIIKSTILDDLRQLNVDRDIQYSNFLEEMISLNPRLLQPLERTSVFKAVQHHIDEIEEKNIQAEEYRKEYRLRELLLYPFIFSDLEDEDLIAVIISEEKSLSAVRKKLISQIENSISQWNL